MTNNERAEGSDRFEPMQDDRRQYTETSTPWPVSQDERVIAIDPFS